MNSLTIKKYIIYTLGIKLIQDVVLKDKRATKDISIPSFRGVLEVKHAIPGRIRLHIPKLKYENGKEAVLQLEKVDGIEKVDINTNIGTVMILYKEKNITPSLIIGIIIRLLGLEEEIERKPHPKALQELKDINESVNMAIYEKTSGFLDLNTLLIVSLLILGVRKTVKSSYRPSGINYLWWSYCLLRN